MDFDDFMPETSQNGVNLADTLNPSPTVENIRWCREYFVTDTTRIGEYYGSRVWSVKMILKELRLIRCLSQEQMAEMSGLNVRTIQRIESGRNASLESLRCLASALEVDLSTLNQEKFMIDKNSEKWRSLPYHLRCWFIFTFLDRHPKRNASKRVVIFSHISGFSFCVLGLVDEAALVGGLLMLTTAYVFSIFLWRGDKYGLWYDDGESEAT